MLTAILIGTGLVAATVFVHTFGLSLALRSLLKSHAAAPTQTWPISWLLIRLAWWLILIHATEITLWALCYLWAGCLPDAESALYLSGVTYTTIGYGDLVLTKPWRMLAPVEGLTGILMSGLSAGLFFAIVTRIYASRVEEKRN